MLIGAVDLILILVTLFAVIAGTVTNPSGRVKLVIILLAVVSSIGTAVKTMDSANTNRINTKLIGSLVQASSPPEYFSHDLVQAIAPLFKASGQSISQQTVYEDSRERILILEPLESDDVSPDYSWNKLIRASEPTFSRRRIPVSPESLSRRRNRLKNRTIDPVIDPSAVQVAVPRRQVDWAV